MTLKVSFAVWNLANFYMSANVARDIDYDMFAHESESERDL